MLARRRTLPSMLEPPYLFSEVPRCAKDLEGSVAIKMEPNRATREEWLRQMPELVQICNEAAERAAQAKAAKEQAAAAEGGEQPEKKKVVYHKPIDLEYLADRVDTDDPLMGYIVRSKAEGWMQGFITVTTFTTWQKYFTWDSLAHEAQVLEDKDDDPESVCDVTGLLARELAAQIHDGDPDGEGVIWPRIAEVSLLGALGCGGWLLKLMLEELEAPNSPYEYVILQASENSIRFYEHHGFTRVGALARYEDDELLNREREAQAEAAGLPKGAVPQGRPVREMVRTSSPTIMAAAKDSETPQQLATRLKLKLFDIIFLNTHLYPGLTSSSKLKAGTQLRVPVVKPPPQERTDGLPPVYLADENETPRQIANKLGVDPKELVKLNKRFLKGLTQHSRLKSNSKLRVPGANGETPDAEDWTLFGDVVGYRHWTFPDETEGAISNTGVSYMMAKKLNPKGRVRGHEEPAPDSRAAALAERVVTVAPPMKATRSGIGIMSVEPPAEAKPEPAATAAGEEAAVAEGMELEGETQGVKRDREGEALPSADGGVPMAEASSPHDPAALSPVAVPVPQAADADAADAAAPEAAAAAAPPPPIVLPPPTGPMPFSRATYKPIKSAFMSLRKQKCAEPFLDPITEEIVPGYSTIISSPMDLATIKAKLEAANRCKYNGKGGSYTSVPELEADIALIIANCRTFNSGTEHGGWYLEMADAFEAVAKKTFEDLDASYRAGKFVQAAASPRGRDEPDAKRQKRMPKSVMEDIWEVLVNTPTEDGLRTVAQLFVALPPRADYPDYYKLITKPVSLNCIKKRIAKGRYDLALFKRDMAQLIENARTYNMPGSVVVQDAETLGEIFKTRAAAAKQQWAGDDEGAPTTDDPAAIARREALQALEARKPPKPKRAITPYFAFMSERRAKLAQEQPDLPHTDTAKVLGEEWKALSEEDKKKYEDVAAEERVRATAAKDQWEAAMATWEKERAEVINQFGTAEEKQEAALAAHKAAKPTPVRTMTAFLHYSNAMRPSVQSTCPDMPITQVSKQIGERWNKLTELEKLPFQAMADEQKEKAAGAIAKYERDLAKWKRQLEVLQPRPKRDSKKPSYLEDDDEDEYEIGPGGRRSKRKTSAPKFFNKVVQVDGLGDRYFYVLTYIPDLFWCRVAPMRQAGIFTAEREKAAKNVTGRPRWMLEPEGEGGGELDISAIRCTLVKARAVKRTQDADKEEWDIADPKEPKQKPTAEAEASQEAAQEGQATEEMAEAVEVPEVAMPEAPVETEAAGEAAAPEAAAEAQAEEASAMEGLGDHQPGEVEEENVAVGGGEDQQAEEEKPEEPPREMEGVDQPRPEEVKQEPEQPQELQQASPPLDAPPPVAADDGGGEESELPVASSAAPDPIGVAQDAPMDIDEPSESGAATQAADAASEAAPELAATAAGDGAAAATEVVPDDQQPGQAQAAGDNDEIAAAGTAAPQQQPQSGGEDDGERSTKLSSPPDDPADDSPTDEEGKATGAAKAAATGLEVEQGAGTAASDDAAGADDQPRITTFFPATAQAND